MAKNYNDYLEFLESAKNQGMACAEPIGPTDFDSDKEWDRDSIHAMLIRSNAYVLGEYLANVLETPDSDWPENKKEYYLDMLTAFNRMFLELAPE